MFHGDDWIGIDEWNTIMRFLEDFIMKKGNCELKNIFFILASEYNYRYLRGDDYLCSDKMVVKIGALADLILKKKKAKSIIQHLIGLEDDFKLKGFRIHGELFQSWEEVNEECNKLWAIAKEKQQMNEVDKFMSAEAAYFWVTNIQENCDELEKNSLEEKLKCYLSERLPESQNKIEILNLIEDILCYTIDDDTQFYRHSHRFYIDRFFLRLNSFVNELGPLKNYIIDQRSHFTINPCGFKRLKLYYRGGEPLIFAKDSEIRICLDVRPFYSIDYRHLMPGKKGQEERKESKDLVTKSVTFGRALTGQNIQNNPDMDLKDKRISKLHFQISFRNGDYYISCMSLTNPTLLRLRKGKKLELKNDMVLNLGLRHLFRIEISNTEKSYITLYYLKHSLQESEVAMGTFSVYKEITIGTNRSNTITMADEEYVDEIHCKIFYNKLDNKWTLEHLADGDNFTFVLIKNYKEYAEYLRVDEEYNKLNATQTKKRVYKPSKPLLLKSGMEIFVSYHVFEVEYYGPWKEPIQVFSF